MDDVLITIVLVIVVFLAPPLSYMALSCRGTKTEEEYKKTQEEWDKACDDLQKALSDFKQALREEMQKLVDKVFNKEVKK